MQHNRLLASTAVVFLTGVLASPSWAGTPPPPPPSFESHMAFSKGSTEAEFLIGGYGAVGTAGDAEEPDFGYVLGSVNIGWMLTDPAGSHCFRGNWEFLVGGFGGYVFEGPGDYLLGGRVSLRYNFIKEGSSVIPYFEVGGGGAYSDASKDDPVQRLIGSDWSWELHASLGVRFMLNDHTSLNLAVQYQHLSNADSNADRNRGMNGLGGSVGMSVFF